MAPSRITSIILYCILTGSLTRAAEPDKKPAPYQAQPGQFPPENSTHYLAGEMIQMDHVNRTGQLRPDRRDDQRTDDYDRAHLFTILPYGTISYHGAPAELRDIPIGTHLHGEFHWNPKAGKDGKGAFTQAFRLEDDFSYHRRRQRAWRLDSVDLKKNTLTVTGLSLTNQKADEKPVVFKLNPATRIWKGRGFGTLTDLSPSQTLLFNITVATLKGPGRCTDIWLDDESRALAASQQLEVHRAYEKAHGLPGWIDAVDNPNRLVTVTLFAGCDPALYKDIKLKSRVPALVAEDTLRCYDQINDRMPSEVIEIRTVPPAPGSSGIQLVIKPEELIEGFRPRRIVRILADSWPLDDLPWEEMLWPADNRVK
ncbi:MAG TPA: hypothetical protein VG796_15675 [Verrucomicrobiales bacterium]|nr:hypothetical protein [Verrucomicrobiales bacterium]